MDCQLDQFIINLKCEVNQKYFNCKIKQENEHVTLIKAENSNGESIYLKKTKLIDLKGASFSKKLLSFKQLYSLDRFKEEEEKYMNEIIDTNRHLATEAFIYSNVLCNGSKYVVHHNSVFKPHVHQNIMCIELAICGISLDDILLDMTAQEQILKRESIIKVTDNVLRGLQYCHGLNVIHCDVKCSNVIFDPIKNVFCLCDFGMARVKPDRHCTVPHSSGVNPDTYQPPEILLGRPFNEKVDIFSLGCMLSGIINWKETFTNIIDKIPYVQRAEYVRTEVSTGESLTYLDDDVHFKTFIISLLSYNHQDRPTASLALENLLASFF